MRHLFAKTVVAPLSVASVSLFYFLRYPRPPSHGPTDGDHEMFSRSREDYLSQLPTQALLRGLFVHSFCTHPRLVDLGIYLMKSQRWPNPIFEPLVRHTFFAQFCGYLVCALYSDSTAEKPERKPSVLVLSSRPAELFPFSVIQRRPPTPRLRSRPLNWRRFAAFKLSAR